jgi:hypothetical protein
VAAELRLGEKSTRQAQDLVCLAQFAHFSLERLDAFFFGSSWPWTLTGITLLLRTQRRSVSGVQPILAAIDVIAAHCDSYWLPASLTMRTARSMTSGEYLGCFFIAPFSQTIEPLQNPGRFTEWFDTNPTKVNRTINGA